MSESQNYIDNLIAEGKIIVDNFSSESERTQVVNALKNIASIASGMEFIENMTSSNKPFQIINDSNIFGGNAAGSVPIRSIDDIRDIDGNLISEGSINEGDLTSRDPASFKITNTFLESEKDHQFEWIDEIKQIPYLSFYDLLNYFINFDKDPNQILHRTVLFSYIYNHKLSEASLLLVKAVNELGLAPKSILPLIETSLKSGNKEFCSAVKNPDKPIAVNQFNKKQKTVLGTITKNCPEGLQINIKP